ncbi:MAG: glycosyltransferase [Deltaproteobacteria bacterium]|nr:glycosyltransferase [Deltaproteobacteria bacterium]
MRGFSLIIPVHNEAPILEANALALDRYLSSIKGLDYEIILACNGCVDSSGEIAAHLAKRSRRIKNLSIEGRGLGTAIKAASVAAAHDMLMFYAIDLPFGLEVIGESVKASLDNNGAVVVGSKGHPGSIVERSLARTLFSGTISLLNNLFFGLGVKDTQGSILFFREPITKYGKYMDNPGPFFQAQILIYSKKCGYEIVEIPVRLKKELRKTRFSLAGDGWRYLKAIFRERVKLLGVR